VTFVVADGRGGAGGRSARSRLVAWRSRHGVAFEVRIGGAGELDEAADLA
jgi:hypothetical protein